MFGKPCEGWCHMHFFDVQMELSYLSYLEGFGSTGPTGPFEWLKACGFGLDNELPVTLEFGTEGRGRNIILTSDFTRTCVFPAPVIYDAEVLIYDDYNVMNLAEDIVMDINRDFDSWVTQWVALNGSHDLSEEDEQFISERLCNTDLSYQAYEKMELRLKKALRETESAWLREKWR